MKSELSYPSEHWANEPDPASALAKAETTGVPIINKVETEIFLSLLPGDLSGLRVLDYGCGCGGVSVLCAQRGAMVTGIDASQCAVQAARLLASREGVEQRCRFHVGTQLLDSEKRSEFNIIMAKDVIEHLHDDAEWLEAVADSLKPNGRLVLSTQNKWSLTYLLEGSYHRLWLGKRDWMGWDPTHVRFYTPKSITHLLKASGFTVERWASMYIVPYDILHWATLLRLNSTLSSLRYVDYLLGGVFPFSRLGWVIMVRARKNKNK